MLTGPFLSRTWLGSCETIADAQWLIVGQPYDGTTSYRPGARFGPDAIRRASHGLETWSPLLRRDLSEVLFYDAGDLELPIGDREGCLARIAKAAEETLAGGKRWFGVGGEHLVTLPVIEAYAQQYENLAVLHFDAHADLRDKYLGEQRSHATVMRRISEVVGAENLVQIGIRSGTQDEWEWMKAHGTLFSFPDEQATARKRLEGKPVFLTVDLDVLDPSECPGTGTPEPGGMSFEQVIQALQEFSGLEFVGADVVECAPDLDPSGRSAVVGAKMVREMLLMISSG